MPEKALEEIRAGITSTTEGMKGFLQSTYAKIMKDMMRSMLKSSKTNNLSNFAEITSDESKFAHARQEAKNNLNNLAASRTISGVNKDIMLMGTNKNTQKLQPGFSERAQVLNSEIGLQREERKKLVADIEEMKYERHQKFLKIGEELEKSTSEKKVKIPISEYKQETATITAKVEKLEADEKTLLKNVRTLDKETSLIVESVPELKSAARPVAAPETKPEQAPPEIEKP